MFVCLLYCFIAQTRTSAYTCTLELQLCPPLTLPCHTVTRFSWTIPHPPTHPLTHSPIHPPTHTHPSKKNLVCPGAGILRKGHPLAWCDTTAQGTHVNTPSRGYPRHVTHLAGRSGVHGDVHSRRRRGDALPDAYVKENLRDGALGRVRDLTGKLREATGTAIRNTRVQRDPG